MNDDQYNECQCEGCKNNKGYYVIQGGYSTKDIFIRNSTVERYGATGEVFPKPKQPE